MSLAAIACITQEDLLCPESSKYSNYYIIRSTKISIASNMNKFYKNLRNITFCCFSEQNFQKFLLKSDFPMRTPLKIGRIRSSGTFVRDVRNNEVVAVDSVRNRRWKNRWHVHVTNALAIEIALWLVSRQLLGDCVMHCHAMKGVRYNEVYTGYIWQVSCKISLLRCEQQHVTIQTGNNKLFP